MEQSLLPKCQGAIEARYRAAANERDATKYYLCSAFVISDTKNGENVKLKEKKAIGAGYKDYFECRECADYFKDATLTTLQEGWTINEDIDNQGSNKIISTAWFGNPSTAEHRSSAFDSFTNLAKKLGPRGYTFKYYYEAAGVNVRDHDFGNGARQYITKIEVNPADGFRALLRDLPHVDDDLINAISEYMSTLNYVGYKACTMAFKKDLLFVIAAYKHGGFFLDTFFRLQPRDMTAQDLDDKLQSAVANVDWPMYPMNGANIATDTPDQVEINALYSPYPEHPTFFNILSSFVRELPEIAHGRFDGSSHEIMLGIKADKPPTKLLGEKMVYAVSNSLLGYLWPKRIPPQFAVWDTEWMTWENDDGQQDARKHLLFTPLGIVKVYSGSHRRPHCGPTAPSAGECASANLALESKCAPFMEICCTNEQQVCAVANSVANCH